MNIKHLQKFNLIGQCITTNKNQPLTNCKLHCGVSGVRCLCFFLDCLRPADADDLPCLSKGTEICNYNL